MTADSSSDPEPRTPNPEPYSGEFTTNSPEETFALAKSIGERLSGGEIFLLSGELGAGKTVFAKGLAAALGIDPSDVTSPSFTLINVHEGRLRFYHIDLYRLESDRQVDLGLEEIFEDETAVTVVEWAERLSFVPARATEVEMFYVSNSERRIGISEFG
jgi:tRNA threonylcarbamoyladenosine biosynthesis protein TsaE